MNLFNSKHFFLAMVMVGAALSREFIAHECAPTEIPNMPGGSTRDIDG
jgi:hypothetical protein